MPAKKKRKTSLRRIPPRQLDLLDGFTLRDDGVSYIVPRKRIATISSKYWITFDANAELIESMLATLANERPRNKGYGTGRTQCAEWPKCKHNACIQWRNEKRDVARRLKSTCLRARIKLNLRDQVLIDHWAAQQDEA